MYKVRFNLSRGKRYKTWKITHPDGSVEYLHPNEISLSMKKCILYNRKKTALKIFNGANKTVCAYVKCEDLDIIYDLDCVLGNKISYNPRIYPNWVDHNGDDIDGKSIDEIVSIGNQLYSI